MQRNILKHLEVYLSIKMTYILKIKKTNCKLYTCKGGIVRASGSRPLTFEKYARAVKSQAHIVNTRAANSKERKALSKLIYIKKL